MRMRQAITTLVSIFVLAAAASAQNPDYVLRIEDVEDNIGSEIAVPVLFDITSASALPVSGWSYAVCHDASVVSLLDVVFGSTTLGLQGGDGPDFEQTNLIDGQGFTVGLIISFLGFETLPPGTDYQLDVATYSLDAEGTTSLEFCDDTLGSPVVDIVVTTPSSTTPPVLQDGTITIDIVPTFQVRAIDGAVAPGDMIEVPVELENLQPLDGFSFGLSHDDTILSLLSIEPGVDVAALRGGAGPEFFRVNVDPAGGSGGTVGVLFSLSAPFEQLALSEGTPHELLVLTYAASDTAPDETETELLFTPDLGSPAIDNLICLAGQTQQPTFTNGRLTIDMDVVAPTSGFIRGDVNQDGTTDISDAITVFNNLFGGAADPLCIDAADANDDGTYTIADGSYLINFVSAGGPAPLPPVGVCAEDPTADSLDCVDFGACP